MPRTKKQHLKRRKDGRYACRYGTKWFMGATEEEALKARDRYKMAEKEGRLAAYQPMTVAEYCRIWLPLHKSNVSVSTYNNYVARLEKALKVIGNQYLDSVTTDDVMRVWQAFSGLSDPTIKCARMLLVDLYDSAVENELCRKNPFRSKSAQPPKLPSGTHRALTKEEIALIETTPHRFQLAAMIMLYAGLRRGELAALTMDDIDLNAGVIHVNKAYVYEHGKPVLTHTKTKAGTRDVPIFAPLRPFLSDRIGTIVRTASGDPATKSALSRGWDSYMKSLSLVAGHEVSIRMHDLRHTFCTMIRDAGVDMHQAIIWMGHSNERMILRIYDHVGEERTKTAVSKVDEMLIGRQIGRQAAVAGQKNAEFPRENG